MRKEFNTGDSVRLDKKFNNSSIVTVVSQTPQKMFTTVTSGPTTWEVMTYRLTEITK